MNRPLAQVDAQHLNGASGGRIRSQPPGEPEGQRDSQIAAAAGHVNDPQRPGGQGRGAQDGPDRRRELASSAGDRIDRGQRVERRQMLARRKRWIVHQLGLPVGLDLPVLHVQHPPPAPRQGLPPSTENIIVERRPVSPGAWLTGMRSGSYRPFPGSYGPDGQGVV